MSDFVERQAMENWLRTETARFDTEADREFVIERLRDELPSVLSWKSAEESPKENYQRAMVYSSETGQMVSGTWFEFGWMIPGPIGKITHWMPIEPPKEEPCSK